MKHQDAKLTAFQVIGIKTRTSNPDEMKGAGKISALWNEFYSEKTADKIDGKLDNEVIAVYFDYESDANGPYSLLVGARVSPGATPPTGMELISVPAQTYTHFTTKKGEMPGVIFEAWKNIWDMTNSSELNRAYSYDFEVYGSRAIDPKSSEVDIFISAKNPK